MTRVEIVRDHASMKAGDKLTVTDRWAAWAKVQGIAIDAPKKTRATADKTTADKASKPKTTEE